MTSHSTLLPVAFNSKQVLERQIIPLGIAFNACLFGACFKERMQETLYKSDWAQISLLNKTIQDYTVVHYKSIMNDQLFTIKTTTKCI